MIVKYLDHEIGFNTIRAILSKIAAIHKIPSPMTKIEPMRSIGSMNFYSNFIDKIHVIIKPPFDLFFDNVKFHWNIELETLFQQSKTSVTKDVTRTLPNKNHPFFITVDSITVDSFLISKKKLRENKLRKLQLTLV